MLPDGFVMEQERGEVFEGIGPCQVAGLNQTHVGVAHLGPLLGLEEQGVLAVEDGPLEHLFTQIVMKGRPSTRRNKVRGSQWFCM